jgi:predicted amidohydrolase
VRVAILIGGDNYLVENVRMTALMGATVLLAPHGGVPDAAGSIWMRRALPARALDNGMFVVFSDGTERGEGASRFGAAAIVDPGGAVIAQGGDTEDSVAADLNTALVRASMGRRWLDARRPTLYGQLARDADEPVLTTSFGPRGASARGSVAVSVAMVRRQRMAW